MDLTNEMQDLEESKTAKEHAEQEQNTTARQIISLMTLILSISLAFYVVIRWLNRLGGDSTTDAPSPKARRKRGRGDNIHELY
jgi:hypothetical protein